MLLFFSHSRFHLLNELINCCVCVRTALPSRKNSHLWLKLNIKPRKSVCVYVCMCGGGARGRIEKKREREQYDYVVRHICKLHELSL
jgi:hypothetical protein